MAREVVKIRSTTIQGWTYTHYFVLLCKTHLYLMYWIQIVIIKLYTKSWINTPMTKSQQKWNFLTFIRVIFVASRSVGLHFTAKMLLFILSMLCVQHSCWWNQTHLRSISSAFQRVLWLKKEKRKKQRERERKRHLVVVLILNPRTVRTLYATIMSRFLFYTGVLLLLSWCVCVWLLHSSL